VAASSSELVAEVTSRVGVANSPELVVEEISLEGVAS